MEVTGRTGPVGRMVSLPSARVHLQVHGEGPTVVYMPDPPNGLEAVAPLVDLLAQRFRVVTFELPGFGWSRPRRGFRWTMHDHARVLAEVMEATEADEAILVAPCLTGFVALSHAQAHPETVTRLVLPQVPSWQAAQHWADRVDRRRLLRGPLGPSLARLAGGAIAQGWYRVAEPERETRGRLVASFRSRYRAGRRFAIASALRAIDAADPAPGTVDLPTLLLWGDLDRSHPATHAHTLAPRCARATCANVAAGHFPELRHPEVVMDWLVAADRA